MGGLPSGEGGLDDSFHEWGLTNNVGRMADYTQEWVENFFKERVQLNTPWQQASSVFWDLIMGGFRSLTEFIESIVQAITGAIGSLPDLSTFIQGIIDDIVGLFGRVSDILDVFGGGLAELRNFVRNLLRLFDIGNIASLLGDPSTFDPFAILRGMVQNLLTPLGLLASLVSGRLPNSQAPPIVTTLNTAINQIGEVLQGGIVTPIIGAVQNVIDWFRDFLGFKNNTVVNQQISQNFTITATSSLSKQPAWASEYEISAVSYPAFLNSFWSVFGRTGPASDGDSHTHQLRGGRDNAYGQAAWWLIPPGESMGAYVRVEQDVVFDRFGVLMTTESPPPPGSLRLDIYREDERGGLTRIVYSSNLADFVSTDEELIVLKWVDFKIVAREGERYVIRVTNLCDPENDCIPRMKGLEWSFGTPEIQHATWDLEESNKDYYSPAEAETITSQGYVTPWVMLAGVRDAIAESRTWTDDFNRDELGANWHPIFIDETDTDSLIIVNGRLTYSGTANGSQQRLHIRACATDGMRVDADLRNLAGNGVTSLMICADREMRDAVALVVSPSQVSIETIVDHVVSNRRRVSRSNTEGQWSMYYDVPSKTYHVLFDGQPIGVSWTDSANEIPHGPNNRYGLIQIQRRNGINSGQVDNWTLRDWKGD